MRGILTFFEKRVGCRDGRIVSPPKSLQDMGRFEDQIAEHGCFVSERPLWVARAPGRLDVMGGTVDYTGGMVLQGLLREAVWVAVQPRTDDAIRIFNPGGGRFGWTPYLEFNVA